MSIFESFTNGISNSLSEFWKELGTILPNLVLGTAVLFMGLLLGIIVEWVFVKVGEKLRLTVLWKRVGFDTFLKKTGIKSRPSEIVGKSMKGVLIMWFLRFAVKIIGFNEVEIFLDGLIKMIPNIVIALLILLFATNFGETMSTIIQNIFTIKKTSRQVLANVARYIIISFGVMAALVQIGIAPDLVKILFMAFVAMLSLAGGLAFGLGGKDFVADLLKDLRTK